MPLLYLPPLTRPFTMSVALAAPSVIGCCLIYIINCRIPMSVLTASKRLLLGLWPTPEKTISRFAKRTRDCLDSLDRKHLFVQLNRHSKHGRETYFFIKPLDKRTICVKHILGCPRFFPPFLLDRYAKEQVHRSCQT